MLDGSQSKGWCGKEYRIGTLTLDDIDEAAQRRVRPASISTPMVQLPEILEGNSVTGDGYTRHDEFHRQYMSELPIPLSRALDKIIFVTRKTTGIKWSN